MIDTKLVKLEQRALVCPDQAKTYVIKDEATLLRANEFIHGIKAMVKEIKDFFKPLKDKAKQAHQALVDKERGLLKPLHEAEETVGPQIAAYLAEQRRIQREAEEKAREAEEERERLKEDRLQRAADAVDAGDAEAIAKIVNETVPEPETKVVIPKATKLEGTGIREDWKWELEKPDDIDKVSREFLCLDVVKLNAYVRAHKEEAIAPMKKQGIRVYSVNTPVFRL